MQVRTGFGLAQTLGNLILEPYPLQLEPQQQIIIQRLTPGLDRENPFIQAMVLIDQMLKVAVVALQCLQLGNVLRELAFQWMLLQWHDNFVLTGDNSSLAGPCLNAGGLCLTERGHHTGSIMSNSRCSACREGQALNFPISMAFQPICDLQNRRVFAHEALVRGPQGEPAGSLLQQVDADNLYAFDQACRVKAVEWGARLNLPGLLSINFMPNAVYQAETCIRATLEAAARFGFPLERIIFEVTEQEQVLDIEHLLQILYAYRKQGFKTAIDDFGSGYAGLNLLADFQPDLLKLDMELIRGIDQDSVRQVLVDGTLQMCRRLGVDVIAEGVETREELAVLKDMGIQLFQGYLLARPGFESLPEVNLAL